jgi:hypothetical protein
VKINRRTIRNVQEKITFQLCFYDTRYWVNRRVGKSRCHRCP